VKLNNSEDMYNYVVTAQKPTSVSVLFILLIIHSFILL